MTRLAVTVIGAGRRVLETALPAFAAAGDAFHVARVLARRERPIESGGTNIAVRPLATLDAPQVAATDVFYVAVGKGAVPTVLAALTAFDVSHAVLLIDTPVLLWKHFRHVARFDRFARVAVAEDCAMLPWYALAFRLARDDFGRLEEVEFVRSAYKYHAGAMAKGLLQAGPPLAASARAIAGAGGSATRREYAFAGGRRAIVIEPRDYAQGSVTLRFEHGIATDAADLAAGDRDRGLEVVKIEPVIAGGRCVGLGAGRHEMRFDAAERALLRFDDPSLSLTARMEDWKRLGFVALLRVIAAGGIPYPVNDGLDDALVDLHLEKFRRFRRNALTGVERRPARWLLSLASRVIGR
jgi:hypothetical protein